MGRGNGSWWIGLVALVVLVGCSRQEAQWREAASRDATAGYQAYLERYPGGPHADEANARIRELQEEREWSRALRLNTPEALQRYLAGFPQGLHAGDARERLADYLLLRQPAGDKLEVTSAPPESTSPPWAIQLGAFGSRAAAESSWQRLSQVHRDVLGEREPQIAQLRDGTTSLWRLRVSAPGEALARDWCLELAARGDACLAVPQ